MKEERAGAGRAKRRFGLFLTAFLLAAAVTTSAALFLPGYKSRLHSSAENGVDANEDLRQEELFTDVAPEDEFAPEIAYMRKKELVRGFEDGTYKPDDPVRREEFIKLVVAAKRADPHPVSNGNCFSDVGQEWFARYVCYAKRTGLVQGYEDGSFGTGSNITVSEAETIIKRAFGDNLRGAAGEEAAFLPGGYEADYDLTRAAAAGLVVRAFNAANSAR